jgi:hypothetical protein
MAKLVPLPDKSVPFLMDDGKTVSQAWYDYLSFINQRGLSQLPDVLLATLSNNQVLIWKSADSKWENGAN